MTTPDAREGMRVWLADHGIYAQPDSILDALIDLEIAMHTTKEKP